MGKPSKTRDLLGAVLLVLVGLLYMTGVTAVPVDHASDGAPTVEISTASTPVGGVEVERRT